MRSASPKGVALITRASTGIGAAHADRLAKRGHDLILAALAECLRGGSGRRVTVLPGAAAELWNIVLCPSPRTIELLLPASAFVDASLAALDAGEQVTFPGIYETEPWRRRKGARAVFSRPGRTTPSAHRQSATEPTIESLMVER